MSKLLAEDDILQFGFHFFNAIGENVSCTSKAIYIYRIFNVTILISTIFFIFDNCAKEGGVAFVKTIEGAITVIHILTKYLAFIDGENGVYNIIKSCLKFWKPIDIGKTEVVRANAVYNLTKAVQYGLLITVIVSAHYYMLKPFIDNRDIFPFNARVPWDSIVLYVVVLFMQFYSICLVAPIVVAYDTIYFATCMHLIIQLRLLKYKFSKVTCGDLDELRICIEHHQLLLKTFRTMQTTYSKLLLVQYMMSLVMACIQLYILSTGKINLADTAELILYLGATYSELAYYSIPVEVINFEFSDISNAIYNSPWYKSDSIIGRQLLTIMTNAQIPRYLKAGGIVSVNVDTFGSVVRKSFSLYLVLKDLM